MSGENGLSRTSTVMPSKRPSVMEADGPGGRFKFTVAP
jgi:hypothetical protein